MTIRESLYFTYAGQNSYDKGLINVNVIGGLFDEPVHGARNALEDRDISGKRYLRKMDEDNLEFTVAFYFQDGFDRDKIRDTTRWLLQETYQPLVFSEYPDRIFYAVATGSYQLVHNGIKQGYLELAFRCNAPHAYSPIYRSPTFDLSDNDSTVVEFDNKGDKDVQPIIYIEKVGQGDIQLKNLSDSGRVMEIVSLVDNEVIKLDCANAELETNMDINRHNDFNFNWLNLVYGVNRVEVTGACRLYYICQFKIY